MSTWSDDFLRSMQFWLLWLGLGLPLLGALAGGVCALVKVRTDHEMGRRQDVARAAQIESELRQRDQAESVLRAQLEQAGKAAAQLEQQTHRRITPDERTKFIDDLEFSPKGKVRVHVNQAADAETLGFADQIRELVTAAGYDAGPTLDLGPGEQIPPGVFMSVKHGHHPFAGALQQAFGTIGVNATGVIDFHIEGDEVRIDVGKKP